MFILAAVSPALLWQNSIATALLLIAISVAAVKLWHEKSDIATYILAAVFGPLAEMISINSGAWQYSNSNAFGIPIWLPLMWGMAGMLANRVSKAVQKSEWMPGKSDAHDAEAHAREFSTTQVPPAVVILEIGRLTVLLRIWI